MAEIYNHFFFPQAAYLAIYNLGFFSSGSPLGHLYCYFVLVFVYKLFILLSEIMRSMDPKSCVICR